MVSAEGQGKAILTAGLRGYFSDRTFKGRFSRGYFFGKELLTQPFEMLATNAYLVRLPASDKAALQGAVFWAHKRFGGAIALHVCDKDAQLVAELPKGFKVLEDAPVRDAMSEAVRIFARLCPELEYGKIKLVPAGHRRIIDRSRTEFEPLIAEARISNRDAKSLKIRGYKNLALAAHQREVAKQAKLREKEERRLQRLRNKAAAEARGMPDVRGLRLGMTLAQVKALFGDDVAEWDPPLKPERKVNPYRQFTQKLRLRDGAKIDAKFTSSVNGSQLFSFGYEQKLRDGPSVDSLKAELTAKYGEPDKKDWRGNVWTYYLVSQRPKPGVGCLVAPALSSARFRRQRAGDLFWHWHGRSRLRRRR